MSSYSFFDSATLGLGLPSMVNLFFSYFWKLSFAVLVLGFLLNLVQQEMVFSLDIERLGLYVFLLRIKIFCLENPQIDIIL